MVHKNYWLIIVVALTACGSQHSTSPQTDLHPFVGCWQSEDGLGIEGWTHGSIRLAVWIGPSIGMRTARSSFSSKCALTANI